VRYLPVLVLALAGCASQTYVRRAEGAPTLPPSSNAAIVAEAPAGAISLGTVTVQGNNFQSGPACEAEAVFQAKKLGATHVIVRPANSSMGRGPTCTGEAFFLGDVMRAQQSAPIATSGPSAMNWVLGLLAIVVVGGGVGYLIGSH
jgi:hypothetical protein